MAGSSEPSGFVDGQPVDPERQEVQAGPDGTEVPRVLAEKDEAPEDRSSKQDRQRKA